MSDLAAAALMPPPPARPPTAPAAPADGEAGSSEASPSRHGQRLLMEWLVKQELDADSLLPQLDLMGVEEPNDLLYLKPHEIEELAVPLEQKLRLTKAISSGPPSQIPFGASACAARPLLTPQVNPGLHYRCCKSA